MTRSRTPVFNCAHCRTISAKHAHTNQEPSNIHQHCNTVLTLLNKKTGLNWQKCTMTSIRRCQHAGVSRQLVGTSVFRISTCNVVCCFIYQGLWTFKRNCQLHGLQKWMGRSSSPARTFCVADLFETLEVISSMTTRTEVGLETLVYSPCNHLTRLLTREYFIELSRHESFKV